MKQNMGTIDKAIRILISAVAIILVVAKVVTGTVAIIAIVAAAIFTLTSLVGFCPLYAPFGLSTKGKS